MNEYQSRVEVEVEELDVKIAKLVDFMHCDIYAKLPAVEQGLVMVQLEFMQGYFRTLTRRIELF